MAAANPTTWPSASAATANEQVVGSYMLNSQAFCKRTQSSAVSSSKDPGKQVDRRERIRAGRALSLLRDEWLCKLICKSLLLLLLLQASDNVSGTESAGCGLSHREDVMNHKRILKQIHLLNRQQMHPKASCRHHHTPPALRCLRHLIRHSSSTRHNRNLACYLKQNRHRPKYSKLFRTCKTARLAQREALAVIATTLYALSIIR